MIMKIMSVLLLASHVAFASFAPVAFAETSLRIPAPVSLELSAIKERFLNVIEEECPSEKCHPVGCKVESFDTLDEEQDSSLPGLETQNKPQKQIQYRLSAASCEFTYEPHIEDADINTIKQRLVQRVRQSGVALNIFPRKLLPKNKVDAPVEAEKSETPKVDPLQMYSNWTDGLRYALLPFFPWFLLLIFLVLSSMLLLWSYRKLGLRRDARLRTRSGDFDSGQSLEGVNGEEGLVVVDPSSTMVLQRISQIKSRLEEEHGLFEAAFRPILEQKNFLDLCLFLKHFDPHFFNVFREKSEYRVVLETLSQKFAEFNQSVSLKELWAFLDRLERALTAAQIRVQHEPIASEFAFLASLNVSEMIELLHDVGDMEAIAAITYAPKMLQEQFFAAAPPAVVAKLVAKLATVDRMSDSFARKTARKLKDYYQEKGDELESISVNPSPLLESALNRLTPDERRKVVSDLSRDKPGLMESLLPGIFLDETLLFVSPEVLTEAFLEIHPQEAAMYLAQFDGGKKVLERLNPRISNNMKKFLNIEKDDDTIMRVRNKIADFIRKKDGEGLVDLKSITLSLIR